ncbi:uncharacterized protein [Argopecten irradians]|uniref:uncharacterized protein n=1 Tax=Argopecten irradians TaxID=31199 RepID=UPI00371F3D36
MAKVGKNGVNCRSVGNVVAPPRKDTDLTSQMADMRKEFQSKIDCLFQVIQEKDDIHATETAKLQKQVDMLKDGCCQNDPRSSSSSKKRNSSEDVSEGDIMSPQTVRSSERRQGIRPESRQKVLRSNYFTASSFKMAVCIISCPVVLLLFSVAQLGDAVAPPQKNTDLTSQMADMRKEFQSKIDYLLQVIQEKDDIHATEIAKLQKQIDMLKDGCCQNDPRSSSSSKKRNSSEDVPEGDIMSPQTVRSSERRQGIRPQSRQKALRVGQTSRTYVAFYSYVKQRLSNLGHNQHIIFDKVVTNVGNAYDLQSGTFRCAVSGIYVFNVHLLALPGQDVDVKLVKNGSVVGYVYAGGESGTFDHGGNTAIVELAEGDSVWVQNEYTQHGTTIDFFYTSFSGFMLYPY